MSLLDEASAFLFGTQAEWILTRIDPPEEDPITGQFRPEEMTEDASTQFAVSNVPMSQHPYIQWTGGNIRTLTFTATLWNQRTLGGALDSMGVSLPDNPFITPYYDVAKVLGQLRKAIAPDPALRRPPRFLFAYGQISMDVFVNALGGIRYTDVWPDGRIKGVTLEIELMEAVEQTSAEITDFSLPPHLSRHRPVVQGDTYESMALRLYGAASIGVLTRQDNKLAFPRPPEVVRLPDRGNYTGRRIEPETYALSSAPAAVKVLRELLDARATSREMPFVLS